MYFFDSGGGSYPEILSTAQAEWFRVKSQQLNPDARLAKNLCSKYSAFQWTQQMSFKNHDFPLFHLEERDAYLGIGSVPPECTDTKILC